MNLMRHLEHGNASLDIAGNSRQKAFIHRCYHHNQPEMFRKIEDARKIFGFVDVFVKRTPIVDSVSGKVLMTNRKNQRLACESDIWLN